MLETTKKLSYKHLFDKKPKDDKGKDGDDDADSADGAKEEEQPDDDGNMFVSDEKRDMEMLQQCQDDNL